VGAWYLLLVVLGTGGALTLAWTYDAKSAETAGTLLAALAPLYLAWKAFRHDRDEAAAVDLGAAADQLAAAVRKQWNDEAAIRRLNDPYPLPVAWRPADPDLVEPWPLLAAMARSWPGGSPSDPGRWPRDATGLAGSDAQIGDVFAHRVPTRRLVVLGEPGSGKTMLLMRLLQDLIERRADGGPVPVLFSLASWNPMDQSLECWLAEQLRQGHPGLRAPVPGTGGNDLAQELLNAWRILPLLDGFDELPPALHDLALDALNRTLPAKQPVVLASRAADFLDAVTRPEATARLNGAAGIHLLPLTSADAAAYLRRDAGGPQNPSADRWNSVIELLGTSTPVGQALSTPLGLFLARTIYNPRLGTPRAPHPDELCDTTAFSTRSDIDTHLFNAFIPAAYTHHHLDLPRRRESEAYRTLAFLARHLETNRGGSPDLAWWELTHALPARALHRTEALTVGLVLGLLGGLAFQLLSELLVGPSSGLTGGISGGLVFGLLSGFLELRSPPLVGSDIPSTRLRWSASSFLGWLVPGFLLGASVGLLVGLAFGFVGGLALGLLGGIAAALLGGLKTEKPDLAAIAGPTKLLVQDRRTFLHNFLAFGLIAGLAAGLAFGLLGGLAFGVVYGLLSGLVGGLLGGLEKAAWGGFAVATSLLAIQGRVPWDLMAFLQDAHENRGVLRQVGAVYQFRHLDLQRHLAQTPEPPVTRSAAETPRP
jgi:hypothetical protein